MRKIEAEEAALLGLPPHEHYDLPENKEILDTLAKQPGEWFHCNWDELGGIGTNAVKLYALRNDASFRTWIINDHIAGFPDGGVFLMRDIME